MNLNLKYTDINKVLLPTMYKNNSRNISKFKGYSPLQLLFNLTRKCHATGYYFYTNRCKQFENE
ncbi:hypothetical protein PEPS_37060 (plasmid) [Persicobacter psychrovividus]|uniref:Uncharacterized protein n=1 Tax=Persicobacter psychrovividus TaxID=387638 RepID=A0ABN6LDZ1_9BACT|nr:hypothetical protein PEPS_37060 [Persicobacter psychrovividus]